MPSPIPFEHIRQISDQASFVEFLRGDLAWPIPEHLDSFDPVAVPYDMFDDLGYKPKDEPRLQVSRLLAMQRGQPWGVFLFKLNTPRIYITDLRKIVRKLSSRRELMKGMPIWKAEHILIIATADWQGFQFLHLRGGDATRAEVHSFGWQGPDDGFLRTLCEFNLPRLRFPAADLLGAPDAAGWLAEWQAAFDVEAVTKAFFKEIANWYFWALHHVTFPKDAPKETDGRDHVSVIRLITRLVFCWFVKEKGLIPKTLFDQNNLDNILSGFAPNDAAAGDSVFYKAILQNLFFATLNTEMDKRAWAKEEHNFMAHSLYRFRECFKKPGEALALFKNIPFLNGGLFECLDKDLGENAKPRYIRIDGFSRRADSQPCVPDFLFFGAEHAVDLSQEYGDSKFRRVPVRGLIHTLQHYRFTIDENTPLEVEVALDPELAGRIFENLLAAYNPETGTTARKATGSFYTPREIVNYMVDESLIAYLKQSLTTNTTPPSALPACVAPPSGGDAALATAEAAATETQRALSADPLEQNLRQLFAYNAEPPAFAPAEINKLITAIDNLKALDPAVGSGAFPMGMLHRLVFLLGKLDPDNKLWRDRQRQRALRETEETFKIGDKDERAHRLEDINNVFEQNASDYGRKLYLIENCIYGVDIQPIAAQIAKMRFFISLIVDQKVDPAAANLGVRPLPNLETKFVAANSLIGIDRPGQQLLRNPAIDEKEHQLRHVREKHFLARTPATKAKCREQDAKLRADIAALLKDDGWDTETAKKLAAWDPYDQNASAPFFDPEWMFGVVDADCRHTAPATMAGKLTLINDTAGQGEFVEGETVKGGFDIVIGNPPYVSALEAKKIIPEDIRSLIRNTFSSASGAYDLYVVFFEAGLRLLAVNGHLCFISPSKYLSAKYAEALRNLLVSVYNLVSITDFSRDRVFESAGVSTLVTVIRKSGTSHKPVLTVRFRPDGEITTLQNDRALLRSLPENIWGFLLSDNAEILLRVLRSSKPLKEIANVNASSTASEADEYMEYLGEESGQWKCRIINTGTIDRYLPAWGIRAFRAGGEEFITPYLDLRRVSKRRLQMYRSPKLIFAKLGKRPEVCIDVSGQYASVNTNFVCEPAPEYCLKFLLAYFNSRMFHFIYSEMFGGLYMLGTYQYQAPQLRLVPVPTATSMQKTPVITRVDRILAAKQKDSAADTASLEREIDEIVYGLYGLTDEEIKIVEGN